MANVYFKRGTQAALDALSAFTEGSFYLTNDTNRLYFAQSSNNLVPLNQFIKIHEGQGMPSASTGEILEDGDFYYLAASNILAIYKDNNWIQINPDTYLQSDQSIVTVSGDSVNNAVQVSTSVTDSKMHTASGNFKIRGTSDVQVSVNQSGEIVISAITDKTNTTYTIGTVTNNANGTINLTNDLDNTDVQQISVNGTNGITVTSDNNGNINISGFDPVSSVANAFSSTGQFVTSITTNVGDVTDTKTSTPIVPTITYGKEQANKLNGTFQNGTAQLDIYTADEIDDLLDAQKRTLDAMTYLGTLSQANASTALNSSDRGVGDTFKASENIKLNSPLIEAKTGDLIIAGGTDDAIVWEVIPSGDDQLIEIEGSVAGKSLTFKDNSVNIGQIRFLEDTSNTSSKINIVATADTNNANLMSFKITHGNAGTGTAQTYAEATGTNREQQTGTAIEIPTISAISLDEHGHIASISAVKYKLTDTHASLSDLVVSTAVNNSNTGTYQLTVNLDGPTGTTKNATFGLTSDNLKITSNGTTSTVLNVNFEWGSF